jgi:hypothetical protein
MDATATEIDLMRKTDLQTPQRNAYRFGMLLDVFHFQRETNYANSMRNLINLRVLGYGVICGLDVKVGPEKDTIIITPGCAIDKWGRVMIVPGETKPITIPAEMLPPPSEKADYEVKEWQGEQYKGDQKDDSYRHWEDKKKHDDMWIKVMLCYHECESDPVPVMAGDCCGTEVCAPSTIREQYRVTFREGRSKPINTTCAIPDFVPREKIDYPSIVRWVTDSCPELAANPCITLANIRVSGGGHHCNDDNIDINVRPIVYSNDLLYNVILSILFDRDRREK